MIVVFLPLVALAQQSPGGLVPCDGPDCDFNSLLEGVNKIINWMIVVAGLVAAGGFSYIGFIFITQGGNSGKRAEAKGIAWKIAVGFFFLLGGWLVVKLIVFGLGGNDSTIRFFDF